MRGSGTIRDPKMGESIQTLEEQLSALLNILNDEEARAINKIHDGFSEELAHYKREKDYYRG